MAAPASLNVLQAGAVISAALITGIRSDLPGQIAAQVTENIYDSPTGRILLVPQGTRVIGQYDNTVQFGQSRVVPAPLHRDLIANAEVLGRKTGQPITDPAKLIAPMVQRFIATDRGAARIRQSSYKL